MFTEEHFKIVLELYKAANMFRKLTCAIMSLNAHFDCKIH